MKNVYALGVIGGYSDGRFVGTNIMNRGQAAIVIQRMAQYAPVQGDKDNDTYDDGTEQTPSTGNTGNTGSSNTGNTGSNTGSTGNTGNTGTTTPEPKPETPAARTLSNDKAITESNVTAILNQLKTKYPNGTDFSKGYTGLGSNRSAINNCIAKIVNTHNTTSGLRCNTTTGCGGWAAFVADEIFGQTNVTWKKTTMANVRPGDLLIILDNNGYLKHVSICVGPVDGQPTTTRINTTDAISGGTGKYHTGWNRLVTTGINIDVYTAYPD